MILTKTPFRMSFFGGGTDIEEYFKNHKGAVISTTFDKYVYVTIRHLPRFFEYTTELVYAQQERVNNLDAIKLKNSLTIFFDLLLNTYFLLVT